MMKISDIHNYLKENFGLLTDGRVSVSSVSGSGQSSILVKSIEIINRPDLQFAYGNTDSSANNEMIVSIEMSSRKVTDSDLEIIKAFLLNPWENMAKRKNIQFIEKKIDFNDNKNEYQMQLMFEVF